MFEKFKEKCKALSRNRAAVVTFVILLLTLTVVLSVSIATNRAKKNNNNEESTTDKTPAEQVTDNTDKNNGVTDGTIESPTHQNTETQPVSGEVEEFELALPTQGVIAKGHDATIQVWSETMGDYRVHLGLDIAAEENAAVCAAAAGTVEKIWDDALMGRCVAISHGDEIYTFYKNLGATLESGIEEGAKVTCGQKIGTVGSTAIAELADEPHLHIEMTVNGLATDPRDYFSAEAKDQLANSSSETGK